jgi:hypothetical protein
MLLAGSVAASRLSHQGAHPFRLPPHLIGNHRGGDGPPEPRTCGGHAGENGDHGGSMSSAALHGRRSHAPMPTMTAAVIKIVVIIEWAAPYRGLVVMTPE